MQLYKARQLIRGQLFKKHFFGPISKTYFIQRSKQELRQVNITLFSERGKGHLLDPGHLLGLIWYMQFNCSYYCFVKVLSEWVCLHGSSSVIFIFVSLLKWGSTLKL